MRRLGSCVGAVLLGALVTPPLAAQAPDDDPGARERAVGAGPADPRELEAFVDGFMDAYLEETDAVGATVSVVRDGGLFFAKGYGYADVESRAQVSPERTLFRIGSVSKLFVWTAVMQLVERDELDLDRDVNEYLPDLEVPATYEEPITLAHLMTHTPGFEDHVVGLFAHDASSVAPLGQLLGAQLPARVRPPGRVASYSNHGTGLAMRVVEAVSGMEWESYLQQHILDPLELRHTTFHQPVPESLVGDLSKGYRIVGGEPREQGFEFVPLGPVGGASASATDMARFMLAHLQLGELDGARILQPNTARTMQTLLFRHHESVNGMAHGFMDLSANGERILGHGGDTLWFHTLWAILPERGLGLFVSFNTAGGNPQRLAEALIDRYFPVEPPPAAQGGATPITARIAGRYRANRFSHTDLGKLAALVVTLEVSSADDRALVTRSPFGGQTRWIEEAPLRFREEHGQRTLVFGEDESGRIGHVFLGDVPVIAFERVPLAEHPSLHILLLVACLAVFSGAVVALPLVAWVRHHYGVVVARGLPRAVWLPAWIGSVLFLLFCLGMAGVLADPNQIAFGVGTALKVLLALPLLGLAAAVVALYQTIQVWRRGLGSPLVRGLHSLVVLGAFVFAWQLSVWNLLGFRY